MNSTRSDALGIVQFIHPGKEQTNVRAGWCPWGLTRNPHRRKFMLSKAEFLRGEENVSDVVGFWGEWEGPSIARETGARGPGHPRFYHLPTYYEPPSYEGLWDTDPFVFGDRFLYNGCQQHTRKGLSETFLRRLAPGSVIMFGSSIDARFVLDTLLVVGDYIDYECGVFDRLAGIVPDEYYGMALHTQTLIEPTVDSFRLYRGATNSNRTGGMFSFTPCKAKSDGYVGFERPNIELPCITQNLTQGKKMTRVSDLDEMAALWTSVREQIEAAGCLPAHRIELDSRRVVA